MDNKRELTQEENRLIQMYLEKRITTWVIGDLAKLIHKTPTNHFSIEILLECMAKIYNRGKV